MKENKLSIIINRPVGEVFEFTINPANTPRWINDIVEEKTSQHSITVSTIYQNKNKQGEWATYKVTTFEQNKCFELRDQNSSYGVRYTFDSIRDNATKLTYFEWVDKKELKNPFSIEALKKLKVIIEGSSDNNS